MIISTIVIVLSVRSVSVLTQNLRKFVVNVVIAVVVVVIEKTGEIGNDFWVSYNPSVGGYSLVVKECIKLGFLCCLKTSPETDNVNL